jgi:hypothetical protein
MSIHKACLVKQNKNSRQFSRSDFPHRGMQKQFWNKTDQIEKMKERKKKKKKKTATQSRIKTL